MTAVGTAGVYIDTVTRAIFVLIAGLAINGLTRSKQGSYVRPFSIPTLTDLIV